MAAALKTIQATVSADGVVTLAEPVIGPCKAVVTVLVDEWTPNATTLAAMSELIDELPRLRSVEDIRSNLGI